MEALGKGPNEQSMRGIRGPELMQLDDRNKQGETRCARLFQLAVRPRTPASTLQGRDVPIQTIRQAVTLNLQGADRLLCSWLSE